MSEWEKSKIHERALTAIAGDQGILDAFNFEVLLSDQGVCRLQCQVPASLVNAGGFAHGSIAYSMLDTAAAYALGSIERRGVTTHGDIKYLRGAQADSILRAEVKVLSETRRVATLRGEVYVVDESGEDVLAAHGSFVFQLQAET